MKSKALPKPLISFRKTKTPSKPNIRPTPVSKAPAKKSPPPYFEQYQRGKTEEIDFPPEPVLFDNSLSSPVINDVIYIAKINIIDSYCVQLCSFIIKVICMCIVIGATIYIYLSGVNDFIPIIILGSSALCCLICTVFVFYYVGVQYAKNQRNLQVRFIVFMICQFIISAASFCGFGYFLYIEMIQNSLKFISEFKTIIDYALIGSILLYYTFGVCILVFICGFAICIWRILWFILIFLYKTFTLKLFATSEIKPRIAPVNVNVINVEPLPNSQPDFDLNSAVGTRNDEMLRDTVSSRMGHKKENSDKLFSSSKISTRENDPLKSSYNSSPITKTHHEKVKIEKAKPKPLRGIVKDYKNVMKTKICSICQRYFNKGEKVVGLTCNVEHVFHPSCLQEKQVGAVNGRGECPTCYKPYFI